jgi:WXG100 family type VII secretion target
VSGDRVGPPPSWPDVQKQADQVSKVDPAAIQRAADQFHDAAANAGDHSAALKQSTDALQGGVWAGNAADAFFGYVKQITNAGDKVKTHLEDVSKDLSTLQGQLADIKGKVQAAFSGAEKTIKDTNEKATAAADAADQQASQAAKDAKAAPAPSAASIIDAAKASDEKVASQAKADIGNLLAQADDLIKKSQELMKTQIEGGYSSVPLPGKDGTVPQSTGGVHSNGAMSGGSHAGGAGGGSGGGGGLGPSGGPPSTTPPGNVQQWIQEAIKILQANGLPVTDADISKIWTIIEKESGGNPNAINNWDCVPIDTMILTRRGWLKHEEVRVGDDTIGYNPVDASAEWTRITRVVHHDDVPLIRMRNKRWYATTTPNHRWVNLPRVTVRRSNLPVTQAQFVTTENVGSRDRLLLAASANTESSIDITVQEAAVLGWIAGEDHGENPRHQFRPDHEYAQNLLSRAGNPKSDAVAQVLAMSTEQRVAWLDAINRSMKTGQVIVYQAPGSVLDAVSLAVYLLGSRPRVLHIGRSVQPETWNPEAAVRSSNPIITGAFLAKEDAGRGDVWCVTTELGTWTAREDDHIFLTGNSNAAAGHPSKGLMQCIDSTFNAHKLPGHDNIYNPVDNIIAGIRYTFGRYGGFAGHPGLKAMAHGGGYQGY